MRPTLPFAVAAVAVLAAGVALANPVSSIYGPRVATDAVAGVTTLTMACLGGLDESLRNYIPQIKVGDRWEVVRGTWVKTGPTMQLDGGSGLMEYQPWDFAVSLQDTPIEVRLVKPPYGFRWTGERLEPEKGYETRTPEWDVYWPSPRREKPSNVHLPARRAAGSSSFAPEPRSLGALAVVLGGLLLVVGSGRRRDPVA